MLIAPVFHSRSAEKFDFWNEDIITLTDDRAEVEADISWLPTRDHTVRVIFLDRVYRTCLDWPLDGMQEVQKFVNRREDNVDYVLLCKSWCGSNYIYKNRAILISTRNLTATNLSRKMDSRMWASKLHVNNMTHDFPFRHHARGHNEGPWAGGPTRVCNLHYGER